MGLVDTSAADAPASSGAATASVAAEPDTAAHVWDLVHNRHAHVYVCGGTAMGADVMAALANAVAGAAGGLGDAAGMAYVKRLMAEGRYVQELWA